MMAMVGMDLGPPWAGFSLTGDRGRANGAI